MKIRFVRKQAGLPGVKEYRGFAQMDLGAKDAKTFTAVRDKDGNVIDYRNVQLKGYLSTFNNIDRDGEYVEPGAYAETLTDPDGFMSNPIILAGHRNAPEYAIGRFTKVVEDNKGLYVEGLLSDAPDAISYRFKVAENILKTMSIGGRFYYRDDGRAIFKVSLREGSLVAIPANGRAIITTRQAADLVEEMEGAVT